VAIVGYTNAGKSTLLNTLTGAGVIAEDKLFATLDTRARRLILPNGKFAILTDTVGFIRDMPKDLFAAFKATFEEAADADLLLEVVDASNPEQEQHEETTESLLRKLDLEHIPRLTVRNKVDLLSPEERQSLHADPRFVAVTALEPASTKVLLERVAAQLASYFRGQDETDGTADDPDAPPLRDSSYAADPCALEPLDDATDGVS